MLTGNQKKFKIFQNTHPLSVLVLIGLLAIILRSQSIRFGLPELYHADEPIVINHAVGYGNGDLNPHFFKVPPLASYILFFIYGIIYVIGNLFSVFATTADYEYLFYLNPTLFYSTARFALGVFPGVATVLGLYKLGKNYADERVGLIAASLMAVCFIHVRDSHYAYVDILLCLLIVAAVDKFVKLSCSTESRMRGVLCGFLIGLATAIKYNGLFLFVPYAVAIWEGKRLKGYLGNLAVTFLACVFTFIVLNPYSALDCRTFFQELLIQSRSNRGLDFVYHVKTSLFEGLTPICFLLALIGLIVRRDKKHIVIVTFILFYYIVLIFAGQPYERYVLPLVPFLLISCAQVIALILRESGRFKRLLGMALLVSCLIPNILKSVRWNQIMSAPDVRDLAKEWVRENIPSGSTIALDIEHYMPRLLMSVDQWDEKSVFLQGDKRVRKLRYLQQRAEKEPSYRLLNLSQEASPEPQFMMGKPQLPYDIQSLQNQGTQYVIVAKLWPNDHEKQFFRDLGEKGKLLASFSPYRLGGPSYSLEHPLTGGPFKWHDLELRERNGQPLEIYQLT